MSEHKQKSSAEESWRQPLLKSFTTPTGPSKTEIKSLSLWHFLCVVTYTVFSAKDIRYGCDAKHMLIYMTDISLKQTSLLTEQVGFNYILRAAASISCLRAKKWGLKVGIVNCARTALWASRNRYAVLV